MILPKADIFESILFEQTTIIKTDNFWSKIAITGSDTSVAPLSKIIEIIESYQIYKHCYNVPINGVEWSVNILVQRPEDVNQRSTWKQQIDSESLKLFTEELKS